jgi:C-terminal processing protease CtpA/Prc
MWLSQKGDGFEVFDVIPGGPADQAGLKVGEQVLAVDGNETAEIVLTRLREYWKTADPGTIVKLQVQDAAGVKRELRFILRDLI